MLITMSHGSRMVIVLRSIGTSQLAAPCVVSATNSAESFPTRTQPPPVVGMNAIVWNCAKHSPIFFFGVWDVLSERGNDTAIGAPGSEMVVHDFCDPAASRMHARDVGRKQEHSLRIATDSFPCFFARSKRQFLNAWTYNFRSVFDKPRHRHLLYEDLFDSVWVRLCLASSTIIALV